MSNGSIPSKVILECGNEREVPHLVTGEALYYLDDSNSWGWADGWAMSGFAGYEPEKEADSYPTVRMSAGDTLEVYVNDVLAECPVVVVDGKGAELLRIEDTAELPSALAKGSHYAYVDVACEGDIIVDHGREETEYAWYRAYFILEIVLTKAGRPAWAACFDNRRGAVGPDAVRVGPRFMSGSLRPRSAPAP